MWCGVYSVCSMQACAAHVGMREACKLLTTPSDTPLTCRAYQLSVILVHFAPLQRVVGKECRHVAMNAALITAHSTRCHAPCLTWNSVTISWRRASARRGEKSSSTTEAPCVSNVLATRGVIADNRDFANCACIVLLMVVVIASNVWDPLCACSNQLL